MTGVHNKKLVKPEHVKPERLGGCLAFRVPYLESRWVNIVFRLLLSSVVALLVLNAVAGKVEQWQETVRLQQLSTVQAQLADACEQEEQAVKSESLTAQRDALQLQYTLLEQLGQLSPAMTQNNRQQDVYQKLEQLNQQIAATYDQSVKDWFQVANGTEALQVMQSFSQLEGYADAANWTSLCRLHMDADIRRQLYYGNTLTAWVENYRLRQTLYPEKTAEMPISFAAIGGSWLCREDQLNLMQQPEELSAGESRAGIRCLEAAGRQLMGGVSDSFPVYPEDVVFDQLIMQGGVSSVVSDNQAPGNDDPAACKLMLTGDDGQSDGLSAIRVLSENVIVIEEGAWKGTYYRILENN